MSRLTPLWKFAKKNINWFVIIVGVLIVGFLDENSIVQRVENHARINELKEEIATLNAQYEDAEAWLRELRQSPDAITRIAREKYFMKMDDEDIFIIREAE